jgi:hypothetical protein
MQFRLFIFIKGSTLGDSIGVSILDPTRHDLKINGSGMDSIFFDPNQIGSGSGQPDPTQLIIFFEVIL